MRVGVRLVLLVFFCECRIFIFQLLEKYVVPTLMKGSPGSQRGVIIGMHGRSLSDDRPSHLYNAGMQHVEFSPTKQALLLAPTGLGGGQGGGVGTVFQGELCCCRCCCYFSPWIILWGVL